MDVPLLLGADSLVDRMLVHALPGELLIAYVPLQDLPEDHCTREDVHLVVVLRCGVPKLGRLPVNSADQAADHRACGLFDLREPKIGNLRNALGCDEDVR